MITSVARAIPVAVAVVAALVGSFPEASAKRPGPVKVEDVVRVLTHRPDPVPADFSKVGSDVDSVLAELVGEPKADVEIRRRAALAIGRFGGHRATAVLTSAMCSRDVPDAVRAAAMVGLARARGEAAFEDVKPFLRDPSPALRIGAAEALGEMRGERARGLLAGTIESEESLEVRSAMERALRAFDR